MPNSKYLFVKTQLNQTYKQVMLVLFLLVISLSVYSQNFAFSNHKLGVNIGYKANSFSKNNLGTDDINLHFKQMPDLSFGIQYFYLLPNSKFVFNITCGIITNSFVAQYDFTNANLEDDKLLESHKIFTIRPNLCMGGAYVVFKNDNIIITQGISVDWLYFNPLKSSYKNKFVKSFEFSQTVLTGKTLDGLNFDIYDVNGAFDKNFYACIETRVFLFYRKPFSFVIQPYITTNFDFLNKNKVINAYRFSYGINIGVNYNLKNIENEK